MSIKIYGTLFVYIIYIYDIQFVNNQIKNLSKRKLFIKNVYLLVIMRKKI